MKNFCLDLREHAKKKQLKKEMIPLTNEETNRIESKKIF